MSENINEEDSEGMSVEDLAFMQFISTARVYDVLMTLLMDADADKAEHLLGLHAEGALLMPTPMFNGVFVTSAANEDVPE